MPPNPGLCATCQQARLLRNGRSTFWLCERSRDDPAFPRYPRLPVLRCRGYEAGDAERAANLSREGGDEHAV